MGEYLVHSKGKWKKHKYIRKEGDRYIYPYSDALASLTGAGPGTAEKLVGHTKRPGTAEKMVGYKKRPNTAEKMVGYKKRPNTAKGGLSAGQSVKNAVNNINRQAKTVGSRGNAATRAYKSARKEVDKAYKNAKREVGKAYRSGKKAVRDIGRKIDNTRIGTSVTTLRDYQTSKPYYIKETPYRVKDLRRETTKSAKSAGRKAYRSGKKAVRDIGRKIDNTKIYTRVKEEMLDKTPNEELIYRTKKPYRVKNLRRDVAKSAKAARKNATSSIKRGRNYIKKKLRR